MATAKKTKATLEFVLVEADLKGGSPEKNLGKSRNIVQVDLVWPRTGIAKKSAAREIVFKKGKTSFEEEPWTKRVLFREEIEDHCGIAVSVTEPISLQKLKRFLALTAKYALKMGADFVEKAMVGYADIASSPIDAIAYMVGEKDSPGVIAQGVVDFSAIPEEGGETIVKIAMKRPSTGKRIGSLTVSVRR